MSLIPKKLQNEKFRFIRIKPNSKEPLDYNWTEKKNYKFHDEIILSHIKNGNYGVATGFGNLLVIDCDDDIAKKLVENNLPKTFETESGTKKPHYYYICKDAKNLKIFKNEQKETLADIQFKGRQVIGPGSIHPNGNKYTIKNDIPLAEIKFEEVINCFSYYLQYSHKLIGKSLEKEIIIEKDIILKDIKDRLVIADILSEKNIPVDNNPTMCPLGHPSQRGKCFSFSDYTFHCFHCEKSGSIFELYMYLNKRTFNQAKEDLAKKTGVKTLNERAKEEGYLFNTFVSGESFVEHARTLLKKQKIWYDDSRVWWLWIDNEYRWKKVDKIDILNVIKKYTKNPISNINIKNEWLGVLKEEAREYRPKNPKKTWIQFKNIIVDVKTNDRIEASPEFFITNPIPWEIGSSDKTPLLDKLFEEWVGKEHVKTLYQIVSYCLIPDYPIHRLFCLFGAGSNGKSKFKDILREFLGKDNTCTTELELLMPSNSRFEITKLHKKLLCEIGETDFTEMKRTAFLKKLTGGDLIGFEYKNKEPFNDYNYAKIVISTNNLPSTTDKTIGYYRRWLILEFINTFTEDEDVFELITDEEYKNLANKSIKILQELLAKRKFHKEGTIEERAKKYEQISNPFDKFWEEMIEEDSHSDIPKHEFRKKLKEWCYENKFREMSDMVISKYMKQHNISDGKVSVDWSETQIRAWLGVKFKEK